MRRAQVDLGSQPVRNLFPYPAFEASGGLVTVRTNLATRPRMQDAALGGYQTQTLTPVTGIVGHPEGITTGLRVSYAAGNTTPGAIILSSPAMSTVYSLSAWVLLESADTPTIAFALKGATSGGSPTTFVQNVWTKITWNNYTTPASLVVGNDFAVRLAGTAAASGSFIITGVTIEQAAIVGPFFDGTTPAAGDFTYAWSGTANASASTQRGTSSSLLTGGGSSLAIQSSEWTASGTKSLRVIPLSASTNLCYAYIALTLKVGVIYTILATARLSAPLAGTLEGRSRSIMVRSGTDFISTAPTNTIGVTNIRMTFTAGAASSQMYFFNGANLGNGDVWWDNVMLVEGIYLGDYVDGTKPFSKWDGTADNSTSVGYPQQLTDFAGKPDLDLFSSGTSVNSGGVAIPVSALSARTIYLCYEAYAATQNYPNFATYGVASSKGITFQTGPAGGTTLFPRFDLPGGSSNIGVSLTNGRKVARHVVAMSFPTGLTPVTSIIDGGADRSDALTPGTGWDDGRASLQGTFTDGRGIRMLVYYAEHDRTTRVAISRYLGNKYGANVA